MLMPRDIHQNHEHFGEDHSFTKIDFTKFVGSMILDVRKLNLIMD